MVVCLSEALARGARCADEVERDEEITQQQLGPPANHSTQPDHCSAGVGSTGHDEFLGEGNLLACFDVLYIVCESSRLSRERVSAHVHVMFCRESASLHMCIDCIGYPDFSLRFLA